LKTQISEISLESLGSNPTPCPWTANSKHPNTSPTAFMTSASSPYAFESITALMQSVLLRRVMSLETLLAVIFEIFYPA
jgi:hypothetical protein